VIPRTKEASLKLLDRPVAPDLLSDRTAEFAQPKTLAHKGAKSVVIFRLGGEWFALATGVFQEVAENRVLHSLPHPRGTLLRGLVSVRGDLLLCVALEALLCPNQELEAAQAPGGRVLLQLLVCNHEGDRLAFPVQEISGVFRYNDEDLQPVPATLSGAAGAFTTGMLPWNGGMAGCLDDTLLFYALNKDLR
jgi:chemotaxis-related protein WspD